ncbi:kinesin-like protein KIN-12E [Brassica napus]|uniref:kinesin-like protein KIN-12E n=1 Tax=Brassica napus TaxID=3708 RepID=UPI0006AAA66C|nr:kinesin-like protein KIN-12E [Brassica napus]
MSEKKRVSAEIQLHEVIANIDLLNELKDGDLTVDAELARLKEMKGDCEDLVAAAMSDWSISELDHPQVSDDSVDQPSRFSLNMASRRSNPRDSDRVRTQTGSANAKHIRSGEVSEALTEVLREETRLPRTSTQEAKDLEGEKSVARVKSSSPTAAVAKPFHWQLSHSKDCPITEDPDNVAHLVRHFKPAGCPLPSLRNMTEREAYVKMAMEANTEFAATVEKRLQDVSRSDELYEIKKVVRELKIGLKMAQDRECANAAQLAAAEKLGNQATSLEARLRVVSNERKSALEQVSFLEAKVESSANKFSDDLRRATYDAKKALADSYLDVLVSLKEKWEKKKAATDCEARLREVMANIDLLKKILNNNLLASDELLRL